ncbi:uncharacterized protein LOC143039637 [Oratosquilla oratoria]|uniref:uncharacterized protein LOC143039637 n=1 Tax=Oratosquilla oratoria TaxID=337810 RepID=UPI003F76FF92
MVIGKINFIQPKSVKGPIRKRFTTEKLINPEVALQLAQKVEENYIEPETRDIKVEWNKFRDGIKKACEDVLQTKTTGRRKKKNTPWWNEVKEWVRRKNKAFSIWMKTRKPQDRQEYVSRRNETEVIKRSAKENSWLKIGDLERDMNRTRKLIFILAKSYRNGNTVPTHFIRDKDDNLLIEQQEISQRWTEYFEELLNFTGQDEAESTIQKI